MNGSNASELDEGQHEWECPECGNVRVIHEYNRSPSKSPVHMVCGGCTPDDGNPMNKEFRDFTVVN